jgi:putative membrane protein insertion efficiency factor
MLRVTPLSARPRESGDPALDSRLRGNERSYARKAGRSDLARLAHNAPRLFGRAFIKLYRYTLSPLIGFDCRHLPTCSDYGDQALDRFGLWAGGWMTLARLLRCQPWGTSGLDFVAEALPEKSRWYMPWRYARWRGTNQIPAGGAHHDEG